MKKLLTVFWAAVFIIAVFALGSCSQIGVEPSGNVDRAIAEADALTNEMLEFIASGDEEGLNNFLAENDPDGTISAILKENNQNSRFQLLPPQELPAVEVPYEVFNVLEDGDVVLFQGDGTTWSNQLMSAIMPSFYSHAAVWRDDLNLDSEITGGFISATIDDDDFGLAYQTVEELWSTSGIITVLDYSLPKGMMENIRFQQAYMGLDAIKASGRQGYSFLYLMVSLTPVDRYDNYWWYCSKVDWRIYDYVYGISIENNNYYLRGTPQYEAMKQSALLKIYYEFLSRRLPGWLAERVLTMKMEVILDELITVDELRTSSLVTGLTVLKGGISGTDDGFGLQFQ